MSPRERFPPDDPREWLSRARSNLALARSGLDDAYLEDLCYEAQQAAEKAIKAVLIDLSVDFPYVHDLSRLLSLVEEAGTVVPGAVRRAGELTAYALITRYPAPARPVTAEEYAAALEIAEATVEWATARV